MVKIVVCAKQVLDPDAVNNYALVGGLHIGEDGKSLTQSTIPRLMNAYDEQAIEAALRLRDGGADVNLAVVSLGLDVDDILKHAAALGADEVVRIDVDSAAIDHHAVAALLAAWIDHSGGVDLVLCGRQASDDDQGVVPALIGEALGMPVVTIARTVELGDGATLRVVRVTPDGDELVEAALPAVATVSNELGEPRYPTMQAKMKARRRAPTVVSPAELGVSDDALTPRVVLSRQFVPEVSGECEFIEVTSAAETADRLVERLRQDGVL